MPRFENTVTLRGHVANPGRYAWKPGMRVRDLIPNSQALLTRRYWRDRAAIVNGRSTEYPLETERPRTNGAESNQTPTNNPSGTTNGARETRDSAANPSSPSEPVDTYGSSSVAEVTAAQNAQNNADPHH